MNAYRQAYVDRGLDRLGLHVYPDHGDGALVVVFPAMGVPARYYRPFAADLAATGLWPVVADLRGTGSSTPRPTRSSRYGYTDLADDVGAVLDALKDRRAGRPTVLLGHSLGGQACALHLARSGDSTVDGLVLVAVGLPHWRCYAGVHRGQVLAITQTIGLAATLLGVWPGWAFGGRQARGVIRDWAYTARHGRFPFPAPLERVTTPVLAVTMDQDWHTPLPTTRALCAMLTAAPITYARHPADHVRWVRDGGPVAARVAGFSRSAR